MTAHYLLPGELSRSERRAKALHNTLAVVAAALFVLCIGCLMAMSAYGCLAEAGWIR